MKIHILSPDFKEEKRMERFVKSCPEVTEIIKSQDINNALYHTYFYDPTIVLVTGEFPYGDCVDVAYFIRLVSSKTQRILVSKNNIDSWEIRRSRISFFIRESSDEFKLFTDLKETIKKINEMGDLVQTYINCEI